MRTEMPINPNFQKLLNNRNRYMVLVGGRGSGKSYYAAQKVILWMLNQQLQERILLCRKILRTVRKSQYQLLKDLISAYNLSSYFKFNNTEMKIYCHATNSEAFALGLDDPEKTKSTEGITKIWAEETTDLNYKDFLDIDLLMRGKSSILYQMLLSFNPINEHHWLNEYFFLNPKDDAHVFLSTYKDNAFIEDKYIEVLRSIRDPHLRKVYLEGKWGVLQNIIYLPYVMLDDFPEVHETIYGLDFGFNNPTSLIEVGIKDQEYYLTQKMYDTKLTNTEVIKRLETLRIDKNAFVYADSAEPARIEEITRAGYNIHPAEKNVKDGIDYCQNCVFYTKAENEDLNKERQSYKWRENKDGIVLDEPEKFEDHLMDALRYAIYTHNHKPKPDVRVI